MPRRSPRSRSAPREDSDDNQNAMDVTSPKRRKLEIDLSKKERALGEEVAEGRRNKISDDDVNEHNEALKSKKSPGKALDPVSVDFHKEENGESHQTEDYDLDNLVLRRGQEFKLTIGFDRDFDQDADNIILQFVVGPRPLESKGTLIRIAVDKTEQENTHHGDWYAFLGDVTGKNVDVTVKPASDAIVGKYGLYVETTCKDENGEELKDREKQDEEFYLLFNPWCKNDDVYVEDEKERAEYVLNEFGRIWCSPYSRGTHWVFGQFDDDVLPAVLYILDKGELSYGARSNVVQVVRMISKMANSSDSDGGILYGRWSETFPKSSTKPWEWVGSVAIIEKFMKTKRAVRYGQCWVFSGLVTTLCRALGIPTRSVTNFDSAHDNDSSMTIDSHWNEADEPLEDLNDSVWNFHVWNESWFKRRDLPPGYDGWQAHDATPQELSDGVFQCGPCPVSGIKKGHVYLPYDAAFIFAEVNGDRVHWLVKEDGTMEPISIQKASVGNRISTKSVHSSRRQDVTDHYKFKEGSEEERESVHRAFQYSSRRQHQMALYGGEEHDVQFELSPPEGAKVGEELKVVAKLKNTTSEERNVRGKFTAIQAFYTGVRARAIATKDIEVTLSSEGEETAEMTLTLDDYINATRSECIIKVYFKAAVKETEKCLAKEVSFSLEKPEIIIEAPSKVTRKEAFETTFQFTNPLPVKLTSCLLHIEAAGIVKCLEVKLDPVEPNGEVSHTLSLTATRRGRRKIVASFSSAQLAGVQGSAKMYAK